MGIGDARFFAKCPVFRIVNMKMVVSSTNGVAQNTENEGPTALLRRQSLDEAD